MIKMDLSDYERNVLIPELRDRYGMSEPEQESFIIETRLNLYQNDYHRQIKPVIVGDIEIIPEISDLIKAYNTNCYGFYMKSFVTGKTSFINIEEPEVENISEEELDFIQNGLGKDTTPEPNYKNLESEKFIELLYETLSNRNYDRYELMLNDYAIMSVSKQSEIKSLVSKMAFNYNNRNAFENFKDEETEKDVVNHMKCFDIMEADISDLFDELHNDKEECI